MTTVTLADGSAREAIREDLDRTFVVEAAAGTGKTTALVGRMVAVLRSGRGRIDSMVAVTFTEAAAGELKLRLRADIERARQDPATSEAARQRLVEALGGLEEARIGTIHSLCADLLRERPVEAGIDPRFEVAAEDVQRTLFGRAFDRWFEEQLADPQEGTRRVLRRKSIGTNTPRRQLRRAAWDLLDFRDFQTRWQPRPFNREPAIDALLASIRAVAVHAEQGSPRDGLTASLNDLARFVREVDRREAVRGARDYDGLEAELLELLRSYKVWKVKGQRWAQHRFKRDDVLAARDRLQEELATFRAQAGQQLACLLQHELWSVIERYERVKAEDGYLDFLDLLLRTRNLVRDRQSVRRELQQRFSHIFIDEFQDTDPLQAELLILLAADDETVCDWRQVRPVAGKLFVVGDPKQSIYRFRRADVALYQSVRQHLETVGATRLHLQVSFRSVPSIQEAVNAAFAERMQETTSQAAYVPLLPQRAEPSGQPAVIALPVPRPYSDQYIRNGEIEKSYPDAVGAFVHWLVEDSGWTVTERDRPGERVRLEPRHICLLLRRFKQWQTDLTRPYVKALEARRIPHVLVGGNAFHQREEVEALRHALTAIEWPDAELEVYATLHGPLFALTDACLLTFKEKVGSLHPYRKTPADLPEALREVADALAVLRHLHRGRNRHPVAVTITRLLEATRAHAGIAIWPAGEQALANLARLMDMARRAEQVGVRSFRSFIERLQEDAEQGETADAPILEEGNEGVRIMTVHKAKGLEFPVVILCDPTASEARQEASRWMDAERNLCAMRLCDVSPPELLEAQDEERHREEEETVRLLYVAATRARDLLVVGAVGDKPLEGWLRTLTPAIYPEGDAPLTLTPAGCPTFGRDSVVERPHEGRPGGAVSPGEHVPQRGAHRIIWWDPHVLQLDREE
ncbi:MAG: UvrD-helicase domain-containing protein, partial [Candidatus Xenobia bacterium]